MLSHIYARHVPAHIRIGQFVADEPRLKWVFPFLHKLPHADVLGWPQCDAVEVVFVHVATAHPLGFEVAERDIDRLRVVRRVQLCVQHEAEVVADRLVVELREEVGL